MKVVLLKRKFLLALLFLMTSVALKAQVLTLPDSLSHIPLATYVQTYFDPDNNEQLPADTSFHAHEGIIFNMGRAEGAYWIKLELLNPDSIPKHLLIEFTNPNLGNIALYKRVDTTKTLLETIGAEYVYSDRPVKHQNLMFPIVLPPQEQTTYFLRAKSGFATLNFDLLLWDAEERKAYTLGSVN